MKGHLGRNPLKKKAEGKPASSIPRPKVKETQSSQWLCVLPAAAFLFTLKTALLIKTVLSPSKSE